MESSKVFFVAQLIHAKFTTLGCQLQDSMSPSLKLTASLPLQIGLKAPKGNEKVFQPSIFRCENVSFREGNNHDRLYI